MTIWAVNKNILCVHWPFIHATPQNEKKSTGQIVFSAAHVHWEWKELCGNSTTGEPIHSCRSFPFRMRMSCWSFCKTASWLCISAILNICAQQAVPAPLLSFSLFPLWPSLVRLSALVSSAWKLFFGLWGPLWLPLWHATSSPGIHSFPPSSGAALTHDWQELMDE